MKPKGTEKPTEHKGPYQPGVVIAAEIAFAALLLYLTNQPFEINSFATKEPPGEPPADEVIIIPDSKVAVVASRTVDTNQPIIELD